MSDLMGTLTHIQTVARGSALTLWDGENVHVALGADFPDVGRFVLDGDPTVYSYGSIVRGEDGSAVLVLPDAVGPDGATEGVVVLLGDDGAPVVDVWAMVETAGVDDATQCLVPHDLRAVLADGARDQPVKIGTVDGVWTLLEIHGRKAEVQVEALSPDVWDQVSASGGNHIWHRTTDPDMPGERTDDIWFRHDPATWAVVGLWTWDAVAAEWGLSPIEGTVLTNVDAGSITTGAMQGIVSAWPSLLAVPRTQATDDGLEIIRGTVEEPYTAARLGGPSGDSLLMQTPEGDLFGFTGGGDLVASSASVESLAIGGEDVLSLLDGRNRVTGWFRSISGTPPRFGSSEMGLFEMSATCRAGRLYEFGGHVSLWCATASSVRLGLRFTNGTDAASTPIPSVTSTSYRDLWVPLPASTWVSVNLTGYYEGQYPSLDQYATRWLWTAANMTGNHEVQMAVSTAGSVVGVMKEIGMPVTGGDWSLGGGTPYTAGTTPTVAPGTRTYKTTWRATAVRSWKLGGSYNDVLYSGSYNGDQRASWLLYGGVALAEDQDPRYPSDAGQSMLAALAGASNLGGWTTLKCTRAWAGSGADVKLSWHGQTSTPGSQPSAGTSPVVSHWTAGTATRGIPAAELPRLQSGASRGLIIGDSSGQATNTTYAQHSAALGDSKITLTYSK